MKIAQTVPEAIDQLEKLLKTYFEKLEGFNDCPVKKEGEYLSDDEEGSDLRINVNGWIILSAFNTTETTPCLWGKRTLPAIHFNIHKEVMVRSIHRDDPDEWDIVDVELDVKNVFQVVEKVVHLMIQNDLDGIGENIAMDDMAQEEEEFSKMEGI